jgi:hypothetical protein
LEVRALIDAEPVAADDSDGLGGWLQRLCRTAARALAVEAAGISVMPSMGEAARLAASGPRAADLEQLQFTLGEGPCQDAYELGRPVLVPDLAEAALSRWPGYAPAVLERSVLAVFAFPLQVGTAKLGVLDIYRESVGSLSAASVVQALAFAAVATAGLIDSQDPTLSRRSEGVGWDDALPVSAELYQAQGMVQVQLGVPLDEAMIRIRAYAFAEGRNLLEVARDIVARKIALDDEA